MKTLVKLSMFTLLASAGLVGFACGGGAGDTETNVPTATTTNTTPTVTASATPVASSATPPVASSATPPPAPKAPPLAVAAMKLTGMGAGNLEMKDDGSVLVNNKPMGKIEGAELKDASGKVIGSVGADNSIKFEGADKAMKFNDKDEAEAEGGGKISVGDDGVVKIIGPDGKPDKESGKGKFNGFKAANRRAATLVVVAVFLQSKKPT